MEMQERGQVALNTAATELLQLHDRYRLDVRQRMPGESVLATATVTATRPQPAPRADVARR